MILPIWLILFVVITSTTGTKSDAHTLNSMEFVIDSELVKAHQDLLSIKLNMKKDSLNELLKREIDTYIDNNAKKNHNIAQSLIDNAIKYDLDICFMMAQAEQETCYGNTGIGKSKKSMFGVVSRSYNTYEECIEDYSLLIRNSYLGNRKTEKHLMDNFVSLSGYRYAEQGYESSIKKRFKKIKNSTNIDKYQKELEEMLI